MNLSAVCIIMIVSIALIWGDHREDPPFHTHHSYWEATIQDRPELALTRYTWDEFQDMPKTHDLYLFVDFSPKLYLLEKKAFKNTAFYWWDSFHFSLALPFQIVPLFDRSYFAEYISAIQARYYGLTVKWLPSAFYPGVFRPLPGRPKIHQYAFAGSHDSVIVRNGDSRWTFLHKLGQDPTLHGYIGVREFLGHAVNGLYNDAHVLFDRTTFPIVGSRFFELIGSGGFCLMNQLAAPSGIEHLAVDGVHYVSYDDSYQDFERKLRYYIGHPAERLQIAHQGHAHFLKYHTYSKRLDVILSDFGLLA